MPIPGAQLGRVQCQIQAFLAVFEGLLVFFTFAGVQKGADQIGLALQLDALCTENAVVQLAMTVAQLHFHIDRRVLAAYRLDEGFALLRVRPQP